MKKFTDSIDKERYCKRGDRDEPSLVCGYPLPCPYHTVIIDTAPDPPTITIPVIPNAPALNPKTLSMLKKIARAIKDGE